MKMANRQLDRARPVNEFVGIVVNATALVALAILVYKAVWELTPPANDMLYQLLRYAASAATIVFSAAAVWGLFAPVLGMLREIRTVPGLKGLGLTAVLLLGIVLLNAQWMYAVAFTFLSLAGSFFGKG